MRGTGLSPRRRRRTTPAPAALAVAIALGGGIVPPAFSQDRERFAIEVEGGPVWQSRNDVRVPNDGGTEFSLVDTIGKGPDTAFRVDVSFDPWERHGFRFVVAPLEVKGEGRFDKAVAFAGETFAAAVPTDAAYKFSSYRVTYRYRFFRGSTWTWKGASPRSFGTPGSPSSRKGARRRTLTSASSPSSISAGRRAGPGAGIFG